MSAPMPLDAVREDELAEYFATSRSWDADRHNRKEQIIRGQRWGLILLGLTTLALSTALSLLVPLKEVDVHVVRVDRSTGIVDSVVRLTDARQTYDEAVTQYFINRYVLLRENYVRSEIEGAFQQLELLTDKKLRRALRDEFQFASPSSPYKKFGEHGTRTVTIKNKSRISDHQYLVRFFAVEKTAGISHEVHYAATIAYAYHDQPEKQSTRDVNPLGFVVTSYRVDVEAVPQSEEGRA